MSIASRAMAAAEIPVHEQPISEQFRVVAKQWVDADAAADLLEETKTAVLSKMMMELGEMPVSKAEMQAKASDAWTEHLTAMVDARARANLLKVQMKYIEMRFSEWQSNDANARKERQFGRQAT